jgi:hypothetical protein
MIWSKWSGKTEILSRFKRLAERCGHRTIRAVVKDASRVEAIRSFAKTNVSDAKMYRYENGLLAFTIAEPGIDEITKEWPGYLPLTWIYTDTLTQQ